MSVDCCIVWSSDAIDFVDPRLFRREAGVGCEDQHQRENTDTTESVDMLQPVSLCTLQVLSIIIYNCTAMYNTVIIVFNLCFIVLSHSVYLYVTGQH